MSVILSVETSTKICSVALHREGHLLGCQELFLEKSHSSQLVVLIQDVLKQCDFSLDDMAAFAVSVGPGSYTGLRIGVSTIKGLCYGLDKPVIAVNTLEAMAYGGGQLNDENALLCPMIDARRMEVYCLIMNHQLEVVEKTQAKIIDEHSFADYLTDQKILFFGNGAAKCREVLGYQQNALFTGRVSPSAIHMGYVAAQKFREKAFEDLAYFEPFYLKDFLAGKPKK
ncbi:tRNA (adenosine(37)-N6)-threonylcarbamoyltransferase complex dimerization subunit type 1 TsaB [Fulvivirgaceae bacterium BMA12]|uniref:tRNA (Adenosine(37)-N6)-threonylcarbamoyltransferase complex dimerization subunit type 1 TsaB n=1 Tax=Agaribacillus aureus TaxID=3051825 RepID=A0ABT8LH82_9BACT|nr:tRNA (adenosine(37)-N6)-threonylcarbamoyltransferase complex dimerization subunit type 1 TsaB [Fulvivirgaceae bacterium BMA12]